MTGVKISELPAAGSAAGGMEFEVNDSGTSRKVTGTQIKAFTDQHTHAPSAIDMAGPGLVGRSGAGAGAAQEVTAVAPFTLGSGNASIELASLTEETSPAAADLLLLEKASGGAKRKVKVENIGGAPTTSEVLTALSGLSYGAVGAFVFAATVNDTTEVTPGNTIAGANLLAAGVRAGVTGSDNETEVRTIGSGLTGTWRALGYKPPRLGSNATRNREATLFLRIS